MFNAKSLLDNLTGGQGVQGLTDKAKQTWDGQSALGKGAIAGGLLGLHPNLHHAFAHGFGVVVLRDVPDFEKHGTVGS